MEKLITLAVAAITANIDFIAVLLVLLGGLFAKHYMTWWNAPTALKTLVMGTLFLVVWCVIQHGAGKLNADGLGKMFFSYCAATSLYEILLKYAFDWLAKKGIKLPGVVTTCLLLGFLLSGCVTQRKAVRYMQDHAFAAASYCASAFPVHDSVAYVPGKRVMLPGDTILIPGRVIPCPQTGSVTIPPYTPPNTGGQVVVSDEPYLIHCPASRLITDTLLRTDTVTLWRENTAKTAAMRGELANLRADSTRAVIVRAKATKRGWLMWGTWIALALVVAGWLFIRSKTALLTSVLRGRL